MSYMKRKVAIMLAVLLMLPAQPAVAFGAPSFDIQEETLKRDFLEFEEEGEEATESTEESTEAAEETTEAAEETTEAEEEITEAAEETTEAAEESTEAAEESTEAEEEITEAVEETTEAAEETTGAEEETTESEEETTESEEETAEVEESSSSEETIAEEEMTEVKEIPEEAGEVIIYNTGNCEVKVASTKEVQEGETGDVYFEEDGSYTIDIQEENPFFPYEVQFKYDGHVASEWFMTPDDSVEINGHTFYVAAHFDNFVVTQMSLEIAGDTVVVYPEKKKFTDGRRTRSLLPLTEKNFTVDLTAYTPIELTMVSVDSIFTGNESLSSTDKVMWTYSGRDNYHLTETGSVIDLSHGTSYDDTPTWEMIVGEDDQLAASNIRYFITLKVKKTEEWLIPIVYKQDSEGNREKVDVLEKRYYDNYISLSREDSRVWLNELRYFVPRDAVEYNAPLYLGLEIDSAFTSAPKYNMLKVYEGSYKNAADAMSAPEITEQILNVDMTNVDEGILLENSRHTNFTMVTFDAGGNVTGCLPIHSNYYRRSNEAKTRLSTSLAIKSNSEWDYIEWDSYETNKENSYEVVKTLYGGYPVNGRYGLTMRYSREGITSDSLVTAAYVGRYTSISEADIAGGENIKDTLFTSIRSGGHIADYSKGVDFTIFVGVDGTDTQEIYYYSVKTEAGTVPLSGETWVHFNGLKDKEGNYISSYEIEAREDSYAEYNYLTILVDENVDLTDLAPVFYTQKSLHLYASGSSTPEVSGESCHDFSDGPVQYTAAAENGTDSKNYWLHVVKATDGEGWLHVNSLAAEDAETKVETGVIYSTREVFLDDFHDGLHDIQIANMGKEDITSLSAELISDVVELDDYWTFKGIHQLSGFDTIDNMSNLAKLSIRAKEEVDDGTDVSGTLTIKSGDVVLMVLTLTGTVGNPTITTEEIPQAVKYVPYGTMIQNSNKYSWNQMSYSIVDGELPAGMILKKNGELYGVPTEAGEFYFTVSLESSEDAFVSSEKMFTLTVEENTDANVEASTDPGYLLTQRVQNINLNSSEDQIMVSQGLYEEFTDLFLDGAKLQDGIDYTSESGSTRITIRSQTLKNAGAGTHTLGIEFRKKSDNTLKRAAQNFEVSGKGKGESSGSGSGKTGLSKDSKKGFMNTTAGIITGQGENYSHWQQDEKGWKLIYADGTTAAGYMLELPDKTMVEQVVWEQVDGLHYVFGVDGYLKNGWVYDYLLLNWYYFTVESGMKTGLYSDPQDGCIYFLDFVTGQIATGWKQVNGKWYYFNEVSLSPTWVFDENTGKWGYDIKSKNKPLGSLYQNEYTPDGYFVGSDGVWDGKVK